MPTSPDEDASETLIRRSSHAGFKITISECKNTKYLLLGLACWAPIFAALLKYKFCSFLITLQSFSSWFKKSCVSAPEPLSTTINS